MAEQFSGEFEKSENINNSADAENQDDVVYKEFVNTPPAESNPAPGEPKKPKKISLGAFIFAAIALILAAVMMTFTLCAAFYNAKIRDIKLKYGENGGEKAQVADYIDVLDRLFKEYSYYDLDEGELIDAVMRAYVKATGDAYAYYYNAEEFKDLQENNAARFQGIGLNIIYSELDYGGSVKKVIKIINVVKDSPRIRQGLKLVIIFILLVWARPKIRRQFGQKRHITHFSALKGRMPSLLSFAQTDRRI